MRFTFTEKDTTIYRSMASATFKYRDDECNTSGKIICKKSNM